MKKKLAFLLAAIMVITSLPGMTLMGSSTNRISRTISTEANTLLLEYGLPVPAGEFTYQHSGRQIQRAQSGSNLMIEMNHALNVPSMFTVTLEGAAWYFRQAARGATGAGDPIWSPTPGGTFNLPIAADQTFAFEVVLPANRWTPGHVAGDFTNIALGAGHGITLQPGDVIMDPAAITALMALLTAHPEVDTVSPALPGVIGTTHNVVSQMPATASLALRIGQLLQPLLNTFVWDEVSLAGTGDAQTLRLEGEFTLAAGTSLPVTATIYTGAPGSAVLPALPLRGVYGPGFLWNEIYPNFTGYPEVDTFIWNTNRFVEFNATTNVTTFHNLTGAPGNVPYRLEIVGGNWQTSATVHILGNSLSVPGTPNELALTDDCVIGIPLVARTTTDGDLRVRVDAGFHQIANTTHVFATHAVGRVSIAFDTVTFRHHEIVVGRTRLTEQRAGSIPEGRWEFEMNAPTGYEWNLPNNLNAIIDSTLSWNTNPASVGQRLATRVQPGTLAADLPTDQITFRYNMRGSIVDHSRILVNVPAGLINPSTQGAGGTLWLATGTAGNYLRLIPENYDTIADNTRLYVNFRNTQNTVLPNTNVFLTTARDFGITLTRVADQGRTNEIPTLISGRLEQDISVQGNRWSGGAEDDHHRAATVRFQETVQDSWWAMRNTVLSLPECESVRFLEVQIYDSRGFLAGNAAAQNLHRGTNQLSGAPRSPESFYNTGLRTGSVTVNHNTITLHGLSVAANSTARFDIRMWLNIQVDFDGDIELTLANSAFRQLGDNYNASVVIATAVSPITVETEVTEARVGFQFVTMADFEITENVAGALLHGEDVYITVTDQIAVDMAIAPGFRQAVTDGNIRISNARTNTMLQWAGVGNNAQRGQLQFTVERASTIASTIAFTDVQVRIDRTVPFSNLSIIETQGYDIHVWGPAVARNFRGLYGQSNDRPFVVQGGAARNERDLFPVGSISAPYVLIETPPEFGAGAFTGRVEVTIPGTTARVNGEVFELGAATWICTASSSAMVPIRFVSYALGLEEGAVMWDEELRTVTVDAGARIVQFQIGNSLYVVNGVPVRMVNAAGQPVEAQIQGDRAFVPFRALGNAFNIPVTWDEATSTAIYNEMLHF